MSRTDAFAALADPTRRAVFERLSSGPRPVVEVARGLPVSRPAVSQHLKVLHDAGLVDVERRGRQHYYGVRPEGLAELRQWLDGFWDTALQSYAEAVKRASSEKGKR